MNTNIPAIDGRTWTLVEAGAYPVELADTIETLAHNPFDGSLNGAFTAHPHRDPLTGEHHAMTYQGNNPSVVHHVVPTDAGKVIREEPIGVMDGPSIHDCAITSRYVLVFDLNVTFSMKAAVKGCSPAGTSARCSSSSAERGCGPELSTVLRPPRQRQRCGA